MITNLLTIATAIFAIQTTELKTNTTESAYSPEEQQVRARLSQLGYVSFVEDKYIYGSSPNRKTEKWNTSVISREEKLKLTWLGVEREIVQSTPLSTNTVHLRLKQEWEEVKEAVLVGQVYYTNSILANVTNTGTTNYNKY